MKLTQEVNVRTACLMTAILLLGCGGQKPVPSRADDFFPMATGYEWKYTTTGINYLDSVRAETTANASSSEFRCVGRAKMPNGREAWVLHRHVRYYNKSEQARARGDTVMRITDTVFTDRLDSLVLYWPARDFDHPNTELVLPLRPGRQWSVMADKACTTWARAVRQESVEVPAGEYAQAWRIEDSTAFADGKTPPARSVRWYAAGVGPVRTEMGSRRADGTSWRQIVELVSAKTGR
jgi:hypothetical protein